LGIREFGSRIDQGYKRIAEELDLPGRDQADVDIFKLVSRALSSTEHGRWLLVLDNIDDEATLFNVEANSASGNDRRNEPLVNFLPHGPHGLTLITTRDHSVARLLAGGEIIKVDYMDFPAAEALFESRMPPKPHWTKSKFVN
jgi:hypothetical protein